MTQWDAPNQQVVRDDASAPWEEGTGGATGEPVAAHTVDEATDLDEMTKEQLLAHARSIGASPANAAMTKEELRASIEAAGG